MRRFDNRGAQIVSIAFGSFALLIGLGLVAQPTDDNRITGIVYAVLGVLFIWRAATTSNVILRADSVEFRSIVRTRHIPLEQLASVDVAVGRTGMNVFGREYLVVNRRDGTTMSFKELNSKPSDAHETVVQQAARAIDEALEKRPPSA